MTSKWLLLLGICFASIPAVAQLAEYREGEHYRVIPTPITESTASAGKVVVTELFSYSCIHCYDFEGPLENWLSKQSEQVEFERVHVVFSNQAFSLAKAYYTAEELGVTDAIHETVFKAIHVNRLRMHQPELLERVFESRAGISAEKFNETFNGFNVENKVRRSDLLVRAWRIEGTPSMVVDGRYVAGGTSIRTNLQILDVVDFLVEKVLREES